MEGLNIAELLRIHEPLSHQLDDIKRDVDVLTSSLNVGDNDVIRALSEAADTFRNFVRIFD